MKNKINRSCIILFLSFVIGMIFTNDINPMVIIRGGEEKVYRIFEGAVISQQIVLNNTRDIHITLGKNSSIEAMDYYNNVPNAAIEVSVQQNDKLNSTYVYCKDLDEGWDLIKLDLDLTEFSNGSAIVTLKGLQIPETYSVGILFTSGKQLINVDNAYYNEVKQEGMYCCLSYGFFSFNVLCYMTLMTMIIIFLGVTIIDITKKWIPKYFPIFTYILVLLVRYVIYIKNTAAAKALDGWIITPWFITYNDGFVSKALPGTILSLFTRYVTQNTLNIVFHVIFVIVNIVLCLTMKMVIDKVESNKMRQAVWLLLILYISSPFSLSNYYRQWGRMDLILAFCFLSSIFFLWRQKVGLSYLVTPISIMAILSHQMYVFVLYPAVFCLFLYLIVIKKQKRMWGPFLLNLLLPAGFALYIQFFGEIKIPIADYLEILTSRTNMNVLSTMVSGEYYISAADNIYTFGKLDIHRYNQSISLVVVTVLMIPVITYCLAIWKELIVRQKNSTNRLCVFGIAIIPIIAPVFLFLTIADYGRVLTLFYLEEIFLILSLLMIDLNDFGNSLCQVNQRYIDKYGIGYFVMLALYLIVLGTCGSTIIPEVCGPISEFINSITIGIARSAGNL